MTIEQIEKLISDTKVPWNNLQTAEWNLAQWRLSLIYELRSAAAKTASQSGKTSTSKSGAKPAG